MTSSWKNHGADSASMPLSLIYKYGVSIQPATGYHPDWKVIDDGQQ
jgi:hypothetical protein